MKPRICGRSNPGFHDFNVPGYCVKLFAILFLQVPCQFHDVLTADPGETSIREADLAEIEMRLSLTANLLSNCKIRLMAVKEV